MVSELEDDVEFAEFADFLSPEETVDKVKTDDLLLDGIAVTLESGVCVASGASTLVVQI